MPSTSENNKRIAKNTLMLYIRMFVIMGVTLYTSRVVLRALGVTDYGIYNVVGGFAMMFIAISDSLSRATSRFITFELGRGKSERLHKVFVTTVIIQLIIAGIIILLTETVGLWFLCTQMNIPPDRMTAAHWVFQFSVLNVIIRLVGVPYIACVIAHERMSAFAYFSIIEAIGKLLIAFLITISPIDKLILYSALMCAFVLMVRALYGWYSMRNFEECHGKWTIERGLMKQVLGFSGWNFVGTSSGMLRDHGINVLLNMFYGPAMNAARGISVQVCSAVTSFSTSFVSAVNPQITKSYAANDRQYTMTLVFQGARLSSYLLFFVTIPILIETPEILRIWLGRTPDYSVLFVRLGAIFVMIESISTTMITLILATGRIRNYQLLLGSLQILCLPVAYLLLKVGCPPESTFEITIAFALACLFMRIYLLRGMTGLSVRRFMHSVLGNVCVVGLLSTIVPYILTLLLPAGILRLALSCTTCLIFTSVITLYVGCSQKERAFVFDKIRAASHKILHKQK